MGLKTKHINFGRKDNGAVDLEGFGWYLDGVRLHYIHVLKFQTIK